MFQKSSGPGAPATGPAVVLDLFPEIHLTRVDRLAVDSDGRAVGLDTKLSSE